MEPEQTQKHNKQLHLIPENQRSNMGKAQVPCDKKVSIHTDRTGTLQLDLRVRNENLNLPSSTERNRNAIR
jgi:hypothetical protein